MNQRIAGMVVVGLIASGLIGAGCDRSTLSSSKADSTDEAVAVEANRASGTQTPPKQPETQTTPAAGQPPGEHIDYDDVPATKAEPNLDLTAAEWKKRLSPQEFQIMRQSGTERAFSGELLHNDKPGTYVCGGCGKRLFSSDTKFKSGTGWPSFFQALEDGSVGLVQDPSGGMERIEVYCTNCGAHLGHLFNDGPDPTGLRYCLDSASLDFQAAKN